MGTGSARLGRTHRAKQCGHWQFILAAAKLGGGGGVDRSRAPPEHQDLGHFHMTISS